ncbi:hypothetical protein QCA50_009202 [Cerrena zonata]|uniref:Major facilitator superfamily (MFS) profile domain-containing protein n=1 Tax=Cerrena zonata TaxID=2478898 RepID=A0AAW0G4M5_9APHY
MNLKIETETDVKVPGTIHLIDVEGNLDVAHEAGDDIVLVPQPTLNPEDPLNWIFAADILTTALSAVLLVIEDDTGIPLGVLNSGLACCVRYGQVMLRVQESETLIEVCIADIFFLHERGAWIAWYCFMLFSIPFASGIAAGFISDRYGWQWIQFIAAIITAVILKKLCFIVTIYSNKIQ